MAYEYVQRKLRVELTRELLGEQLAQLQQWRQGPHGYDDSFFGYEWTGKVRSILRNHFGSPSVQLRDFEDAARVKGINIGIHCSDPKELQAEFDKMLSRVESFLKAVIFELNSIPVRLTPLGLVAEPEDQKPFSSTSFTESPKAFVAHGGESPARDKLKDFLCALGIKPLIVEESPSEGRSVNENVEHYFNQSDCAIILATKGDIDAKTKEFIPRGNILIEVGMCIQKLPNRTIYLLEEEAKFPTDISEKVWEHFTQDNMERAFIKVANELRAFGLIKAIKVEQ